MHKYVGAWYLNKPDEASADVVSVPLATTTSRIDASLAVGGTISGTVTDASTGLPLAEMCVSVTGPTSVFGSELTAADGTYRFGGLGTGDYEVEFSDCDAGVYATEWYDAKADQTSANAVHVVVGYDTPGIDAALGKGSAITGTVTDAATGTPLDGVCVSVVSPSTGQTVAFAETGPDGGYSAAPLFAGSYKVAFDDCGSGVYATEWYDNKLTFLSADAVSVVAGHDTGGIDVGLDLGGTISGTVTDATSGALLAGMCVQADLAGSAGDDFDSRFYAITGADGTYTIRPLVTGTYIVYFSDCDSGRYLDQYYSGEAGKTSADPVGVAIGQNTPHIDAALVPAP
jgi:hypothetical protein